MKKIILSLAFAALLISCKEETREKVKEASIAVGSEVKTAAKKTKEKVENSKRSLWRHKKKLDCQTSFLSYL